MNVEKHGFEVKARVPKLEKFPTRHIELTAKKCIAEVFGNEAAKSVKGDDGKFSGATLYFKVGFVPACLRLSYSFEDDKIKQVSIKGSASTQEAGKITSISQNVRFYQKSEARVSKKLETTASQITAALNDLKKQTDFITDLVNASKDGIKIAGVVYKLLYISCDMGSSRECVAFAAGKREIAVYANRIVFEQVRGLRIQDPDKNISFSCSGDLVDSVKYAVKEMDSLIKDKLKQTLEFDKSMLEKELAEMNQHLADINKQLENL
jgi:hypothetical protein